MKHYVLFNPLAANNTCACKAQCMKEKFSDAECIDMTKVDYAELASRIQDDDVIVLCGGDGTINRFVNDTEALSIGNEILYYAAGTGNDFLRDIDVENPDEPISITKYIKNLPKVEVKGKTYRFLNAVGYGIDGYCCEVGDKIRSSGKKKDINYTAIAIKGVLFHHKPSNAKVTVDGNTMEFKKVWIAPAMHGRYYGGGMMAAPQQDRLSDDGMLTLVVWHSTCRLRTLMAFPGIFKGEHVKHPFINLFRGHEITVEFDRPTALQVDGETVLGVTSYTAYSSKRANEA